MRLHPSLVATALLLVPATASAEGKVAVLDVQTTGIDTELVGILTEILTAQIQALGVYDEVIAGRDVAAMIGFEKQKDLVGCTDESCVAEIGGALGVDHIVAGHVGKVGASFIVNIKLINILTARAEKRVYQTVKGDDDVLIKTIEDSVHKLVPEADGGDHHAASDHHGGTASPGPASSSGVGAGPIILWSLGAVSLGAGAAFGLKAKGHHTNATDGTTVGGQTDIDKGKTSALLANISYGVGVAAAATGLILWLVSGDDEAQTAIGPAFTGDTVGIAGRF